MSERADGDFERHSQSCASDKDVPWKGMAGIRDRLIHHYFGVNLDIVWDSDLGD
jgi:uncharacterized protein with HEPN domain